MYRNVKVTLSFMFSLICTFPTNNFTIGTISQFFLQAKRRSDWLPQGDRNMNLICEKNIGAIHVHVIYQLCDNMKVIRNLVQLWTKSCLRKRMKSSKYNYIKLNLSAIQFRNLNKGWLGATSLKISTVIVKWALPKQNFTPIISHCICFLIFFYLYLRFPRSFFLNICNCSCICTF